MRASGPDPDLARGADACLSLPLDADLLAAQILVVQRKDAHRLLGRAELPFSETHKSFDPVTENIR
ncbi:MAG: hypothetical protein PHG14_03910 [Desulfobacter postgatei]|uniref:hypothetical protein n=1 Tax=Desulfobacter postgatei TaxID=2293 RepID=UPI0023F4B3DA|nr:hypothetical protein [Desulfobacter postgatei]MDD4272856.1 hypothetical protein [Desulfobacter postgatei]